MTLEQSWEDNEYTISGTFQHQRVHTARVEQRGEDIFLYELNVYSRSLRVNGKCDCVEAHSKPNGVILPYGEGKFRLYPVEYKHGVVRQEEEYNIQLCAQAMCLEEQFNCYIPAGAIFYINSHRRNEVELTNSLREKTFEISKKVWEMINRETMPDAVYGAKCKKCSMLSVCQPKIKHSAKSYCKSLWELVLDEETQ